MANQGNRSQSGSATGSPDDRDRNKGDQDRNRSQPNQPVPNQGDRKQGGMEQGNKGGNQGDGFKGSEPGSGSTPDRDRNRGNADPKHRESDAD
ncbi:MAG TPA: hypothetical protein VN700_00060 [Vicinamibacterales bacterium]|nr:hypothetical protein [Vicinamibacterales bacterium]